MKESATTKLSNSFALLSLEDIDSQLANTYDISMRIIEFEKALHKFDLINVSLFVTLLYRLSFFRSIFPIFGCNRDKN